MPGASDGGRGQGRCACCGEHQKSAANERQKRQKRQKVRKDPRQYAENRSDARRDRVRQTSVRRASEPPRERQTDVPSLCTDGTSRLRLLCSGLGQARAGR